MTVTKKKKTPKPPRRGASKIAVSTYQKMWAAYQQRQSVEHVRKACRVSWRTADKYIDEGDPTRGMEPLRDRFAKVMQKAQRDEDYGLVKARRDTLTLIRAYKTKLANRIKTITTDNMSASIGNEIDRIARLEEELLTKAPPSDQTAEALFEGWTDEEMEAYAQTGKWPDRPLDAPAKEEAHD